MTTNTIQKLLTLPSVPLIAILSAYLLGLLLEYLVAFSTSLALHDEWYFVPDPWIYIVSAYVIGFLPATFLRRVIGPVPAAIAAPLTATLYELFQLQLSGHFGILSAASALIYYLLSWFIANLIGLAIWDEPPREPRTLASE